MRDAILLIVLFTNYDQEMFHAGYEFAFHFNRILAMLALGVAHCDSLRVLSA